MNRGCQIDIYGDSQLVIIEILGNLTASAEKDIDIAYNKA